MNSKLCKRLRRQAERETEGQKPIAYWQNERTRVITLQSTCTRAHYRRLKEDHR